MAEDFGIQPQLSEAISSFKCTKDSDIETFLREKAESFDKKDICRTYIIVDTSALKRKEIIIEAYFTLSYKALNFDTSVSRTRREKITRDRDAEVYCFVLIGQLGKYINESDKPDSRVSLISLHQIMDYACEIILANHRHIPCRAILVEIKKPDIDEKLRHAYKTCGFKEFQDDENFYQYIKLLES